MRRFLLVSLMSLSLAACSAMGLQPALPPTAQTAKPTAVEAASSLTLGQIKNMKIRLVADDAHPTVQLAEGEYHRGSDPGVPDFADIRILADEIAFGDLNGDGEADAAVLVAENYGGTGVFVSLLAVLDSNGQPVQEGASMIDDRPVVNGLEIRYGQIHLDVKIHGPNDPGCCAALPVTQTFGLEGSDLTLLRLASGTPDGSQRLIHIESPAEGAQVPAAPLEVKGNFTVAPFENTLAYRAYDTAHNTLAAGTLPAAPGASTGGTFDTFIDLTSIPAGTLARVEILDMSAADGSTIAMDSVELMIK